MCNMCYANVWVGVAQEVVTGGGDHSGTHSIEEMLTSWDDALTRNVDRRCLARSSSTSC
jgi:hypothetical protein